MTVLFFLLLLNPGIGLQVNLVVIFFISCFTIMIRNLAYVIFVLLIFVSTSVSATSGIPPEAVDSLHNSSNDSIIPDANQPGRWENPELDTRFNRGTIQPWHDTRSIYLRRSVPPSHLACLRRENQA